MLVQEAYSLIAARCALSESSATHKTQMLNAMNGQLKRLYTNLNLQSERASNTLTTVADTYLYYLDSRVLRAVNFRETDTPSKLDFMSREDFEKQYPNPASTDDGLPNLYVPMRKVRVTTQPTATSTISITSSSASDVTSYYVLVRGISGGVEKTERLLLTGATAVVSTNSYTSLIAITKDTTNGTLTATSNSGAVTNISLLAGEKEKEHWEVRLHPIPDDAYSFPYTFQYSPWLLSNDEDLIPLPDINTEAFLAFVTAQIMFENGDSKYANWKAEATTQLMEIQDENFLGMDEDVRFGFEDVTYPTDFT